LWGNRGKTEHRSKKNLGVRSFLFNVRPFHPSP
jgi:hypothetical protein